MHRQDEALFGELYYDWHKTELTLGLRGYRDWQRLKSLAEGAGEGYVVHDDGGATQSGVTPKVTIAYKPDSQTMVYASAAKGFREGGVSQAPIAQCALLSDLGG